jgi:excisionase family DNA binding protein
MIAMKDDKGRKMLSCREAAEEYGCSMRYIRKLALQGKLTHEIVGGAYLVAADEVRKAKTPLEKICSSALAIGSDLGTISQPDARRL